MNLINLIAGSLGYSSDAITANWANIILVSPTTSGTNANVTCSWTITSPRTFKITYGGVGQMYYRINSGTYVAVANNGTWSVATGEAVNYKYENTTGTNEAEIVTITDNTRGGSIDTFIVQSTGWGGGGGGGGGGGCVELDSHIFQVPTTAAGIFAGNEIFSTSEDMQKDSMVLVSRSEIKEQPCVRIVTDNGVSLICSITAPLPTQENKLVKAPETIGLHVATMLFGEREWSKVVRVDHLGLRSVNHITAGNRCFWAGEYDGAYILHHNVDKV